MNTQKIKKTLLEVHKPSSQISSIYELNKKQIILTPFQFDTMNFICFKAREQILTKYKSDDIIEQYKTDDALFDFLRTQQIEINLKELSEFTNKYKGKNKNNIMYIIRELEDIKIKVGIFKQDDLMVENRFNLISRTKRITNSKKITVWLEPELILGWVFGATPFKKLYLKVQTLLKYTYSKILYENCKDYENIGKIEKPFTLWVQLFNIKSENVSRLKYNYLNKAIKEINANTDIFIDKIYGTKKDGKTIMTVEFHKQECDLITEADKEELSIEDQILMNKAELIYENLPKFRKDKIKNKEQYIKSIFKKDYDKLKNELLIDNWINNILNNIPISSDQPQTISILVDDNAYAINDKYLVIDLDSNDTITQNATGTINFINNIIENQEHSIEMLELGNNHEFSKSSVNLF